MKKNAPDHRCLPGRFAAGLFLILPVILFNQTSVPRAETAFPAEAAIEKVVDLGTIETPPVIMGRDGGYSVLFNNRSVWVFGDTIIRQTDPLAPALLSNSCSWTTDRDAGDGITGIEPCRDLRGIPQELIPFTDEERMFNRDHRAGNCRSGPCGARWALWPGAIINDSAEDRLLLFFKKVRVKPGILNFQTVGHSLAVWRTFHEPPERVKPPDLMFGENEPAFGSAAVVVESMVYVFGCSLDGHAKPCRLARVPLATVTDRRAWEFYSASQAWQKEIRNSRVVLEGNDMMSVSYNSFLKRYLAVYSQPMGTGVMLRTAKEVAGPWFEPPESIRCQSAGKRYRLDL